MLGEDIRIRILTYHHYIQSLPADPSADILLTWDAAGVAPEDRALAYGEAVRPICSPAYAATHAQNPRRACRRLERADVSRPAAANEGWASWEDWFAVAGRPDATPRRLGFDSYTYVLEAAAAGHGIALGWRGFIERSLEAGTLVTLGDGFVEFNSAYYGVLTEKGRRKPLARRCLAFFDRSR